MGKPINETEERIERVENRLLEVRYKEGLDVAFSGEKPL